MASNGPVGDFSIQELRELVEMELNRVFESLNSAPALSKAARYTVFPGGKRIRPVLALSLCADLGGDPQKLAPAAVALELLHCASLVHDDLPALDNDDFRRGRPSCHKAFSEATAILAGDMLIALAHGCALNAPLSGEAQGILGRALSRAFIDLCAGQELDLRLDERREDLLAIHRLKTGALFGACSVFGVVGAGRSWHECDVANRLGHAVGIAFQIADDFIDVYGSDAARGRPGSSDQRNGKENLFNSPSQAPWNLLADTEREIRTALNELSAVNTPRFNYLVDTIVTPLREARKAHDSSEPLTK